MRAVVIAANGPAFSAGHDLKELTARRSDADRGRGYFAQIMTACSAMMQAIVNLPKPVIAAVQGIATAAGCQLVASCDLAVASEAASFATPGVDIGLFCSTPMVALSRNVPRKQAMEMLLTGEHGRGRRARATSGSINRVVAAGDRARRGDRAGQAGRARNPPTRLKIGKAAFYRQAEMSLAEAYRYAAEVMTENMMARDAEEGIGAFIEKREPKLGGSIMKHLVLVAAVFAHRSRPTPRSRRISPPSSAAAGKAIGISYYAMNQWWVANLAPPSLKAIIPWEGAADLYRDALYHGGILSVFMTNWFTAHLLHHTLGRASRIAPDRWKTDTMYRWLHDSLDSGALRGAQAQWDKITVPMFTAGNWSGMALHLRGNTEAFMRAASKHKKLRIHAGSHVHAFYTEEGRADQIRFLDYWLKGIDNGVMDEPPVKLAIRHGNDKLEWRHEHEWPLARTQWTKFYFDLSQAPPAGKPQTGILAKDNPGEPRARALMRRPASAPWARPRPLPRR